MSLLEEAKENCIFLERVSQSDGRGGISYTWTEGEEFTACIYLEDSLQAQIAEAKGVKGVYQITVERDVNLPFNTVFKRVTDDHVFRVTSKDDNATPLSAGLNMRVVRAEDYTLE